MANIGNIPDFDEALANSASIQQRAPYFTQIFQDFQNMMRRRGRLGREDTGQILSQLGLGTTQYLGGSERLTQQALEDIGAGFAERGIYESGIRRRGEGLIQGQAGRERESFLRGQQTQGENAQQKLARLLEGIGIEQEQEKRRLGGLQEREVAQDVEEARRLAGIRSTGLSSFSPAPGENYLDFLKRRGSYYQGYL